MKEINLSRPAPAAVAPVAPVAPTTTAPAAPAATDTPAITVPGVKK
jgi:hypothetical protein